MNNSIQSPGMLWDKNAKVSKNVIEIQECEKVGHTENLSNANVFPLYYTWVWVGGTRRLEEAARTVRLSLFLELRVVRRSLLGLTARTPPVHQKSQVKRKGVCDMKKFLKNSLKMILGVVAALFVWAVLQVNEKQCKSEKDT